MSDLPRLMVERTEQALATPVPTPGKKRRRKAGKRARASRKRNR